jgi:hypothetical protein
VLTLALPTHSNLNPQQIARAPQPEWVPPDGDGLPRETELTDADERDDKDDLNEIREARNGARVLIIAGEPWRVFELRNAYDRRGPSLVFESEHVIRVVRLFPAEWIALPDEELFRLSQGR